MIKHLRPFFFVLYYKMTPEKLILLNPIPYDVGGGMISLESKDYAPILLSLEEYERIKHAAKNMLILQVLGLN